MTLFGDIVNKCLEFESETPKLFSDAYNLIKNIDTLAKIYELLWLFKLIMRSKCIKYTHLGDALEAMQADDSILIQFTDIDLYCIFNNSQYTSFIENINDYGELYQIVFTGKRQKLVFACTDKSYIDKLQDYAKEYINAGKKEIASIYHELYMNNDDNGALKEIKALAAFNNKYKGIIVNNTIQCHDVRSILDALKSVTHVVINGDIVINNVNGKNNSITIGR
jgi:hypothetical protein